LYILIKNTNEEGGGFLPSSLPAREKENLRANTQLLLDTNSPQAFGEFLY
jgi:hypothetical protein